MGVWWLVGVGGCGKGFRFVAKCLCDIIDTANVLVRALTRVVTFKTGMRILARNQSLDMTEGGLQFPTPIR